jgi:hypothetical protein
VEAETILVEGADVAGTSTLAPRPMNNGKSYQLKTRKEYMKTDNGHQNKDHNKAIVLNYHWRSGTARGCLPQGSFPTQWTRLRTEPVCVGSRLHKPTVCTRPGTHCRQIEAWSCIPRLTEHAYSHPIPMGQGSVMGH